MLVMTCATSAAADRIFLKSGKIIKGDIVSVQDDYVRIETGIGIPLTYFKDQIERLDTRDFEMSFRRPPTDEEMTERVAELIKEWRAARDQRDQRLRSWVRAYKWYAQADGKIVVERYYRNPQLERESGRKVSGTVKLYFQPDELWQP